MKTNEINIRDPYVLVFDGKYYLYGTRSETCWTKAFGFDAYVSDDLENWDGPFEIFNRPDDFFASENFWAPECYCYNGSFYLLTTFGGENFKKGVYILKSDSPLGPFSLYGERLTPENWSSIDGTLYFKDEKIYMIFSHSFEDTPDGDMCVVELSSDLSRAISEPKVLFSAPEAKWANPIPFAKSEFGMDGDVYFTDGPCVLETDDGSLYMLWSSWGTRGYAVGVCKSENGEIYGDWSQQDEPIWKENGGHGMAFTDKSGKLLFTMHYPNDKLCEKPCFKELILSKEEIKLI